MRIPGWKTARLVGRWARSRILGRAMVLGYHRVADAARDPFGLCVSPRHFREQMQVLRGTASPVALRELARRLTSGGLGRGAIAVTFDDGYRDFGDAAEPIMQRYEIPATVFVVSGWLGRQLWWNDLADLILDAPRKARHATVERTGRQPLNLDLSSSSARHATLLALHRRMMHEGSEQQRETLEELRRAIGSENSGEESCPLMTMADIARVAKTELTDIGSHSVSHPVLGRLPESEQFDELQRSRVFLEEVTGQPVREFSYPHGSIGQRTQDLVSKAGYESACASVQDTLRDTSDPLRLPRFWVPDWDGEQFSRWLHRWKS